MITRSRKHGKLKVWTVVILACALAGGVAAAAASGPFWLGAGLGLFLSGYVALQANFETFGNRDFSRAQRGEEDEAKKSGLYGGRHRSSGDVPPHGGGGVGL